MSDFYSRDPTIPRPPAFTKPMKKADAPDPTPKRRKGGMIPYPTLFMKSKRKGGMGRGRDVA